MRHGAVTIAGQVQELHHSAAWDILFCSDMLNLAEFRGLAPAWLAALPSVVYFHENQLTYPAPRAQERDLHLAFSNFTTAMAANRVWFNSDFHKEDFLQALATWMRRMPDHRPLAVIEQVRQKSLVLPPSIEPREPRTGPRAGPLHIVWSARWEYDKNPALLFDALRLVRDSGVAFQLSVMGESFKEVPQEFEHAQNEFAQQIVHWGFLPKESYREVLSQADIFVSTADHEFFGIAAAEAIEAGAFPLLPERLAYPELLDLAANEDRSRYFYDGSATMLCERVVELARMIEAEHCLYAASKTARIAVKRFHHRAQVAQRDAKLTSMSQR